MPCRQVAPVKSTSSLRPYGESSDEQGSSHAAQSASEVTGTQDESSLSHAAGGFGRVCGSMVMTAACEEDHEHRPQGRGTTHCMGAGLFMFTNLMFTAAAHPALLDARTLRKLHSAILQGRTAAGPSRPADRALTHRQGRLAQASASPIARVVGVAGEERARRARGSGCLAAAVAREARGVRIDAVASLMAGAGADVVVLARGRRRDAVVEVVDLILPGVTLLRRGDALLDVLLELSDAARRSGWMRHDTRVGLYRAVEVFLASATELQLTARVR